MKKRSWLDRLAPPLSLRRQVLRLAKHARHIQRTQGTAAVVQFVRHSALHYRRSGVVFEAVSEYGNWIRDVEPAGNLPGRLSYEPVVSILTPVYNTPLDVLAAAIESVRRQTYSRWTLCIANGGSAADGVRELLDRYAALDSRIAVRHLERNLGISGNSNAALELATGEFVSLLDHDDMLAADMLQAVVELLNIDPGADIVYFDEDKISADGATRAYPWFKPQWSPDLLLSTNVLMHSVIRRSVMTEVHGFDPSMDGAQDWDLMLRITQRTEKIKHLPRVLYHWRQIAGSVALDANAKPWAYDAQARCLSAHLRRIGAEGASVSVPSLGLVRIHWPVHDTIVSIIIPTKDNVALLRACLTSIVEKSTYSRYEIIVVDTGSTEADTLSYYERLRTDARFRVLACSAGPFNYSRANNVGATAAAGDMLLFLNNDTEVLEPSWLEEMAGWASRKEIGVVGAKLLRPDGLIQQAGIVLGLGGHGSHIFEGAPEHDYGPFGSPEWVRDYEAVTGACLMMRREVFEEIGGFDEIYRIAYSDIELCLRARSAGYRVVYTPFARVLHHEGASRGLSFPASDVIRASCQIIGKVADGDRYFNPNLSYLSRRPAFAKRDEPTPQANIVRVLEAFELVPPGSVQHATAIATSLRIPDEWRSRKSPRQSSTPRVLLVSHDLSLSGAPLMLAQLVAALTSNGCRATVLAAEDGPIHEGLLASQAHVVVRPELGHLMVNFAPLTDLVADHDLVVANTIVNWRAIHVARAFAKASLLWLHEFRYGRKLAKRSPQVATAITNAGHVVLPARAQVEQYREFLIDGRFSVIPYGLDLSAAETDAAPTRATDERIRVVHVGSLEPRKGQDWLLKSLALMTAEQRSGLEVQFVGRPLHPPFAARVREMARPMPNVRFLGEADRAQTLRYLRDAEILVLSSRDEVLPISILEAMFYGKAIIASDVGGVSEMIENDVSGLLVPLNDAAALAAALIKLSGDRALIARLGSQARQSFVQRYTADRFAGRFVPLVRTLLETDATVDGSAAAVASADQRTNTTTVSPVG